MQEIQCPMSHVNTYISNFNCGKMFMTYLNKLQSHPDLFLTYLGGRFGDENSFPTNEEEGQLPGYMPFVAVCDRLPAKDSKAQR